MILATWNVNSVNTRLVQVLDWLKGSSPDVLCLQEIKTMEEKFPHQAFRQVGYDSVCFGQKSYNGVAILSRLPITAVSKGFAEDGPEEHRRFISAKIAGIDVLNTYVPNGQAVDSEKYEYKLRWLAQLKRYLEQFRKNTDQIVWCGDFNIAPLDIDVYDAVAYGQQIMCSPTERQALESIGEWGLKDAFRTHNKDGGHFSWWDYRMGAFRRNLGFRIDHIWVTAPLVGRCQKVWIDKEPRKLEKPSDHAPVLAQIASD
jgi:exodeoxyribonuclease III